MAKSPSPRAPPESDSKPTVNIIDSPSNPFDSLPIETVQQIATYIDTDNDLCAFQLSCCSARDAVNGDNFSLWRRRFISCFEPTGWTQAENVKYKTQYRRRRQLLKNGANFLDGKSRNERECMELLRELIVCSFVDQKSLAVSRNLNDIITVVDPEHPSESRNINNIIKFVCSTNLLTTIFRPVLARSSRFGNTSSKEVLTIEPLLLTLRVVCAPLLLSLEPHLLHEHFGFPDSQQAVYSTATARPFFGGRCGLDIDMELVLHHINFWRYHMVREAEQTLFHAFSALEAAEKPQWWTSQLKQGDKTFGKYWKGSFAFLDPEDLDDFRDLTDPYSPSRKANEDAGPPIFQDIFAGENHGFAFQDMQLSVLPDGVKMPWPKAFEQHLNSLTPPTPASPTTSTVRTRAQKRSDSASGTPDSIASFKPLSFRFDGEGVDDEAFLASGWLNPLPMQQGIPGWRRLTMMKYYELPGEEEGPGVYSANVDWNGLWAYEGVVLPGGKLVVGRWWSPRALQEGEEVYSGPFVLWCVDGAEGYRVWDEEDGDAEGKKVG